MNYSKLYQRIIDNRQRHPLPPETYQETHHIVPRCLGGTNTKDNLVALSAREHFLCHYLLAKMFPERSDSWYKTNHAFLMLKSSSICNQRYFNSRLYSELRENFSIVMSRSQTGESNSQFGTRWIHNEELKQSMKWPKDKQIPDGWSVGRKIKFRTEHELVIRHELIKQQAKKYRKKKQAAKPKIHKEPGINKAQLKAQRTELRKQKKIEDEKNNQLLAQRLFNLLITKQYKSITQLANSNEWDKSDVSLINLLKRYIVEYSEYVSERKPFGK